MTTRLAVLLSMLALSLVALSQRSTIQVWLSHMEPSAHAGEVAPELPANLRTLDGVPLTLASLRGRVVLVHFWTFDCGNCEHMVPSYTRWDRDYRARGLSIVGVHTPEEPHERDLGRLSKVVADKHITWPVVPDPGYLAWDAFGVKAWPTIFVIGKDGMIVRTFVGDEDASAIERLVTSLL